MKRALADLETKRKRIFSYNRQEPSKLSVGWPGTNFKFYNIKNQLDIPSYTVIFIAFENELEKYVVDCFTNEST